MDFRATLGWRLKVRQRRKMAVEAVEFATHAGRVYLIKWREHPLDPDQVKVEDQLLVDERFNGVAGRMIEIVERYYRELAFNQPSSGFHWTNVTNALALGSGCLSAASEWFQTCSAPTETVDAIFVVVRNAVGSLATSPTLVSSVKVEAIAEATLKAMDERRQTARCADVRIVA